MYTDELGDKICDLIATHTCSIAELSRNNPGLPVEQTISEWRYKIPGFGEKYMLAKARQAMLFAEEIISISDDSRQDKVINAAGEEVPNTELIARSRLRVDTRKWYASKLVPKIFGNGLLLEEAVTENLALKAELTELRDKLAKKYEKDH